MRNFTVTIRTKCICTVHGSLRPHTTRQRRYQLTKWIRENYQDTNFHLSGWVAQTQGCARSLAVSRRYSRKNTAGEYNSAVRRQIFGGVGTVVFTAPQGSKLAKQPRYTVLCLGSSRTVPLCHFPDRRMFAGSKFPGPTFTGLLNFAR
jgi:hypothetical protein